MALGWALWEWPSQTDVTSATQRVPLPPASVSVPGEWSRRVTRGGEATGGVRLPRAGAAGGGGPSGRADGRPGVEPACVCVLSPRGASLAGKDVPCHVCSPRPPSGRAGVLGTWPWESLAWRQLAPSPAGAGSPCPCLLARSTLRGGLGCLLPATCRHLALRNDVRSLAWCLHQALTGRRGCERSWGRLFLCTRL